MSLAFRSILPTLAAWTLLVAGCPSDDTEDTGATTVDTHEHGTSTADTASTATTEHQHDTGSGTAATADTHEHGSETAAPEDPAAIYCACVFASCHEPYHMKWGEDEMAAEAACLMEAEGLPVNGSDIDMGNFIECRQHYCDLAATDPTQCGNALGDAVCL